MKEQACRYRYRWVARFDDARILPKVVTGIGSLLKGMRLTLGYLVDFRKVVTQQYPENRETLAMFPRYRGRLALVFDPDGNHRCTACTMCEKACPNGTISVLGGKDESGRKVLKRYLYRMGQCTFCGLCVESCPFGAIRMVPEFELAVCDRAELVLVLNLEQR